MREHIAHERRKARLVEAQFHPFEVMLDGPSTDPKTGRDLLESLAAGDELDDLALPGTQVTATGGR